MSRKKFEVNIEGAFFVRVAAGVGWGIGVIAQGEYKVNIEDPLSWNNMSGSVSVGAAGKGVSVDVGGKVSADFSLIE